MEYRDLEHLIEDIEMTGKRFEGDLQLTCLLRLEKTIAFCTKELINNLHHIYSIMRNQ